MSEAVEVGHFLTELETIEEANEAYFLIGGQAVNVWAEVYSDHAPEVRSYAPFTSRDCDIRVSYDLWKKIGKILPGSLAKSTSPAEGQLGIFHIKGTPAKTIDLFDGVYGLTKKEVERAQERSLLFEKIRVIDPLFLFKAKCHNLAHLPQDGRNDERHLLILATILPKHFSNLLSQVSNNPQTNNEISERNFLKEIKLFLSFSKDKYVRNALKKLDIQLIDLIPIRDMTTCGFPKIQEFADRITSE